MRYLILMVLLLIPVVSALEGSIQIVTVNEDTNNGDVAKLDLEITDGRGRVFIDTFPLTALNTQVSARMAKQVACKSISKDCSNLDFFYTLRANAVIVGGPSSGAAMAVLAASLLDDLKLKENVTITGTINPGGMIGTVGGIKGKIDAAAKEGFAIVIPAPSDNITAGNISIDPVEYGVLNGIEVVKAATLDDALAVFAGKPIERVTFRIDVPQEYYDMMETLRQATCERTEELKIAANDSGFNDYKNLTEQRLLYSAASLCFDSNIRLQEALLRDQNLTEDDYKALVQDYKTRISSIDVIKDNANLEIYLATKDRIDEALRFLKQAESGTDYRALATAIERYFNINNWLMYINAEGNQPITNDVLKKLCYNKLQETTILYEYGKTFYRDRLDNNALEGAEESARQADYELCIYKTIKFRSEVNNLLSLLSVGNNLVDEYISQKLDVVNNVIAKEKLFPVMAYSYYEYANTLKDKDKAASSLFAEYALELSNLDLYYENEPFYIKERFDTQLVYAFAIGIAVGILFAAVFIKIRKRI